MSQVQAAPIPAHQKAFLTQLSHDLRAALSYVSFYSIESPFVVQAVQKVHKDIVRLLQSVEPLYLHIQVGRVYANGAALSELDDLMKNLQERNLTGVAMTKGLTSGELSQWIKSMALPQAQAALEGHEESDHPHIRTLSADCFVALAAGEDAAPEAATPGFEIPAAPADASPFSLDALSKTPPAPAQALVPVPAKPSAASNEAFLSFVAEAWQFSQLQKRALGDAPGMAALVLSFDRLFERLLDRMEKASPEAASIYQWFKAPPGELLESQAVFAMYPLLEVAVLNGWTSVLFDPATEGLVNDCLAYWGANGRHDLVERTVRCLAEGLSGDTTERGLALTHLMDARPWVSHAELVDVVLNQINSLLAHETYASLYQSGLLLAWDLLGPAMLNRQEPAVLSLLSTLHFHADEDTAAFPERCHIARHWLFERSTPELVRRFIQCAYVAGQLHHYPLLGEMAAPLLLEDFFMASGPDKAAYYPLFSEIKEPIRSVLSEWLADIKDEGDVRTIIPILRVCGMDAALSLQLCSWVAKGGRELKLNLIGLIEEAADPMGGPALRLALFDDSEEIAASAARVLGKIGFTAGVPVLLKAAKIRGERFEKNDEFLAALCQSLGDLGAAAGVPFLEDVARKKPLFRGRNFSMNVRLEAVRALSRINQPDVWHFLGTLMEEKNPALQETLDKIIHDKVQTMH